jgi:hypothetical protein
MLPAERDTLISMEIPVDTPEGVQSSRVWPFLFEPRWIGWHLFVVAAFWGMLWLGDWQFHRAIAGNGLSWAYTFEWPLFAGFGLVFWARTVRDEFRLRRGTDGGDDAEAWSADSMLPAGLGLPRPSGRLAITAGTAASHESDDAEDAEIDGYNDYLAKLHDNIKSTHGKWQGF